MRFSRHFNSASKIEEIYNSYDLDLTIYQHRFLMYFVIKFNKILFHKCIKGDEYIIK